MPGLAQSATQSKEHGSKQRPRHPAPAVQGAVAGPEPGLALAFMDAEVAPIGSILALQRAAGNRAVSRILQPKLIVGPAGGAREAEADRVAEHVLTGLGANAAHVAQPSRRASRHWDANTQTKPSVLRQWADEEDVQTKADTQRQWADEEDLQAKRLSQQRGHEQEALSKASAPGDGFPSGRGAQITEPGGEFEAGTDVEHGIELERPHGAPLSPDVAGYMQPRFGADFSAVRVHTTPRSAELSHKISAQAFTHGSDIFMPASRYEPGTTAGKRLLAHELAHVVQQGGASAYRQTATAGATIRRLGGKRFTGKTPQTGQDSGEYLKFVLANPDMLSEAERKSFMEFTGMPAPTAPLLLPDEQVPAEPSRWERFKAYFADKPKTLAEMIAEQLKNEFKGYAGVKGFFKGVRKAQKLQEEQHGVLTEAQERNIDTLATLDWAKLRELDFMLPAEAEARAHTALLRPDELADLPAKQQMQIITYQHRFAVSGPTAASEEDQRKLDALKAKMGLGKKPEPKEKPGVVRPEPGQDLTKLAQDEQSKRATQPPVTSLPPKVEPKGGMPDSSKVVIKPGEHGEDTTKHDIGAYRDAAAAMVREAQKHRGMISQNAEMLTTDFVDVNEGGERFRELEGERAKAADILKTLGAFTGSSVAKKEKLTQQEMKQVAARVKWAEDEGVERSSPESSAGG